MSEDEKIVELSKLGYTSAEAMEALGLSGYDVEAAILHLEAKEEEKATREEQVRSLSNSGDWLEDAVRTALTQSGHNLSLAQEMLEKEEKFMGEHFEEAVRDMVGQGWEEGVARQALLTQVSSVSTPKKPTTPKPIPPLQNILFSLNSLNSCI